MKPLALTHDTDRRAATKISTFLHTLLYDWYKGEHRFYPTVPNYRRSLIWLLDHTGLTLKIDHAPVSSIVKVFIELQCDVLLDEHGAMVIKSRTNNDQVTIDYTGSITLIRSGGTIVIERDCYRVRKEGEIVLVIPYNLKTAGEYEVTHFLTKLESIR